MKQLGGLPLAFSNPRVSGAPPATSGPMLGPGCSPQQLMPCEVIALGVTEPLTEVNLLTSPSSKMTIKSPSSLNAGELRINGTVAFRKALAPTRPPPKWTPSVTSPFLHAFTAPFPSCPSWQRLGVMKTKFAVVDSCCRSCANWLKLTTCLAHSPLSISEWKKTKELGRGAY